MQLRKLLLRAALLLLAVIAVDWWYPAAASPIRRPESGCIRQCERIRPVCDARCLLDCAAIYAGDQARISACVATCRGYCIVEYKDCRVGCFLALCVDGDPPPCPQPED